LGKDQSHRISIDSFLRLKHHGNCKSLEHGCRFYSILLFQVDFILLEYQTLFMTQAKTKMTTPLFLLILTAICSSLIAGLFYAYSVSVNPGLHALSDEQYVAAMQSINKAILNPFFFATFMGTLVLLPVSTYLHVSHANKAKFVLLLTASIIYILLVFGVTVVKNVPLNEELARYDLSSASPEAITSARVKFENTWNAWHQVRTLSCIIAAAFVIVACTSEVFSNNDNA
jgi:uncharacterized membrane protein